MFPWLKALGWLLVAGGAGTLVFYHQLPDHKKREADRLLGDYAVELFNKKLDQLNSTEAKTVFDMARRHFAN